jgi:hypothetical protein
LMEGWYDCLTCPTGKVFLYPHNIWKYGVTRKGENRRYGLKTLSKEGLYYQVQFVGDYAGCLIQEKIKIFNYPLLPENLARPNHLRLVYPPGNRQDN